MNHSLPLTVIIAKGKAHWIEGVILSSGSKPAEDFLKEIEDVREKSKEHPQSTARAKFMVLFQQMANYGQLPRKRFGVEMEGFYAFKHEVRNIQIRFPCFRDGTKWVVTHGFKKPGAQQGLGQWPQAQIDRALEIRGEYYSRKNAAKPRNR